MHLIKESNFGNITTCHSWNNSSKSLPIPKGPPLSPSDFMIHCLWEIHTSHRLPNIRALELDNLACAFHYSYVHPRKMCVIHKMELTVLQL